MLKMKNCLLAFIAVFLAVGFIRSGQRAEMLSEVEKLFISEEELALNDGNPERAVRSRMVWDWAVEYGMADEFSYDVFLQSLETENKKRENIHAKGEPVYGPVQFTPLQYYRRLLGEYEQEIQKRMAQEISLPELTGYYETHQENYRAADTVEAEYTIRQEGRVVYQGDVILDAGNIRTLSEADEELVNNLLQLEEGGQYVWFGRNGEEKQLVCIRREQGECAPFEEVSGAVADQYAEEWFEQELMNRAAKYQMQKQREKEA